MEFVMRGRCSPHFGKPEATTAVEQIIQVSVDKELVIMYNVTLGGVQE